jgi:uncharacterized LabA/DUF88 family protein
MTTSEPSEETAAEEKPKRRGGRTRRTTKAEAETAEATTAAETPAAEEPAPGTEDAEADAPRPRARRGTRGGAGRSRSRAKTAEAETESTAEAPAAPEPEAAAEPAAEPVADGEPVAETPKPRTRRGTRGGAGRRKPAGRPVAPELPSSDHGPPVPNGRVARPERTERPARPAPSRGGGSSGGIEGLIARQNVLFEDFAQQQGQTLREVQRALRGSGGAQGAAGNMMALPRVAIFLDVPNLIYAADQLNVKVDFGKLLDYLTEGRQLVRATAYAPITDDPQTRFEKQRFVEPVINHGYKIVTKPWKRFNDGSMKANFDIELAVDILTMSDRLDIVVLLSGDGDFRRVCELVESKGVRVEVVSFAQSTAMELRAVADQYTDLNGILDVVGG